MGILASLRGGDSAMSRIQSDYPSTPSALFSSSGLDSYGNGEPALLTSPRGTMNALDQATMGMDNLKVVRLIAVDKSRYTKPSKKFTSVLTYIFQHLPIFLGI